MEEKSTPSRAVENASAALKMVLEVQPGETLLLVTHESTLNIGEIFAIAGLRLGMIVKMVTLLEALRPYEEVPQEVKGALSTFRPEVTLNILDKSAEETPFRIKLIKTETSFETRLGHIPGATMHLLTTGPLALSEVEYQEMQANAQRLQHSLSSTSVIQVITRLGTEIQLSVKGREWVSDVKITKKHWGNLPCGELFVAPQESSLNGVLVVDGAIGDFGVPPKVLYMHVKDGVIHRVECADQRFLDEVRSFLAHDELAMTVGELGIGFNPKADPRSPNMLDAEKAAGTVHIAFGNNIDFGGRNKSETHRDFLILDPTLQADEKTLMRSGRLLL